MNTVFEYGYRVGVEGIKEEKAKRLMENEKELEKFLKGFTSEWKKGFLKGLYHRFRK